MDYNQLRRIIEQAILNLYANQPNIFGFTSQTGQTEWNLAHHLANELSALLPGYDCDVDVTKHEYGNMRPDIIFHKRGINGRNLLVVEMKFRGSPEDVRSDIDKIRNQWFTVNLRYQFGAAINLIDADDSEMHLIQNY